jgi:ABC-type iron transport system FetAB ATPase subunit
LRDEADAFKLIAMNAHTPTALIIKDLSIGALHQINLTIEPGEVLCLSGESGAGKSRMLRAVADLEPHEGTVCLGDTNRNDWPAHEWRQRVMLVPAESQWWADSVAEHFCQPMPKALEALGFSDEAMRWSVSRLSSGEKQRFAAARALACQPHALLLDEPTANLDDDNTEQFERWILGEIKQHQMPVIWVAHDEAQMKRVGARHFRIKGDHLEHAS